MTLDHRLSPCPAPCGLIALTPQHVARSTGDGAPELSGRHNSRPGAMRTEPELDVVDPLKAGREALSRGEWEQALAYLEAASERNHSAETIEALAMAAWWLDNAQLAIESREQAYRLYRERGDTAAAARMAIWLGWDSLAFRGEPAVARGWLQRAHRLLEG